jgi:hypothetical protein
VIIAQSSPASVFFDYLDDLVVAFPVEVVFVVAPLLLVLGLADVDARALVFLTAVLRVFVRLAVLREELRLPFVTVPLPSSLSAAVASPTFLRVVVRRVVFGAAVAPSLSTTVFLRAVRRVVPAGAFLPSGCGCPSEPRCAAMTSS